MEVFAQLCDKRIYKHQETSKSIGFFLKTPMIIQNLSLIIISFKQHFMAAMRNSVVCGN